MFELVLVVFFIYLHASDVVSWILMMMNTADCPSDGGTASWKTSIAATHNRWNGRDPSLRLHRAGSGIVFDKCVGSEDEDPSSWSLFCWGSLVFMPVMGSAGRRQGHALGWCSLLCRGGVVVLRKQWDIRDLVVVRNKARGFHIHMNS